MPRKATTTTEAVETEPTEAPVEEATENLVEETALPVKRVQLRREWLQKVAGGAEHPTWKLVLDALHQLGVRSIETEIIAFPTPENGNVACVKARIVIGDGSLYEAHGYASTENIPNKMIAKHLIHMAETRAKGRAGRDATNIGEALAEEFGEGETRQQTPLHAPNPSYVQVYTILKNPDDPRRVAVRQHIIENYGQLQKLQDLQDVPNEVLEGALRVAS